VWPEKALTLVRSTRIAKKEGATVVKQLQEITTYPEKVCWRLAERHGFRRPHCRREWSQEDIDRILKMCESDRSVSEIAEYFGTTVRTIHQKIIKNGKTVGRNGSIYTVSLISGVLRVARATVRQWAAEGRLELKSETRGNVTVQFVTDDEFERFCRKNHNYLIYEVGGRIAPRERIQFLKEFVMAADMPDDHTARSHKRERDSYVQQMNPDADKEDDEDDDQYEDRQDDQN
jgi:transposase-like protein